MVIIMDCAIYTRVSTDNQAEKEYNSCEAQEEKKKAYIRSQENLKLYKVYSHPGFSGTSLERPGLKQMLHGKGSGFIVDFFPSVVSNYFIARKPRIEFPREFFHIIVRENSRSALSPRSFFTMPAS